jgi:hypothetical protein
LENQTPLQPVRGGKRMIQIKFPFYPTLQVDFPMIPSQEVASDGCRLAVENHVQAILHPYV